MTTTTLNNETSLFVTDLLTWKVHCHTIYVPVFMETTSVKYPYTQ